MSSAAAAGDGLAIAITGDEFAACWVGAATAKGQDVHAAVTGGTGAEGFEDYVGDSLRGAPVSGADGGVGGWVEKCAFRDNNFDWLHAAWEWSALNRVSHRFRPGLAFI